MGSYKHMLGWGGQHKENCKGRPNCPCPTAPARKPKSAALQICRNKAGRGLCFLRRNLKPKNNNQLFQVSCIIQYLLLPSLKVLILPVNKIIPLTKWVRQSCSGTWDLSETIQVMNYHGFLKLLSSSIDKRAANTICLIYVFYHSSSQAVQLR